MPASRLIADNLDTLSQALTVLEATPRAGLDFGDRIGPHLRHVLDHYSCLLDGLDGAHVNYDARERDAGCESSIERCHARLQDTMVRLRAITSRQLALPLEIELSSAADAPSVTTLSSLGRELQFVQSHAIHHFALISQLLEQAGAPGDDDFGKAPSTVKYERSSACAQ